MATSISIHRVTKLSVEDTKQLNIPDGEPVFLRTIQIETTEGTFTINLFAEGPNSLKLEEDNA